LSVISRQSEHTTDLARRVTVIEDRAVRILVTDD